MGGAQCSTSETKDGIMPDTSNPSRRIHRRSSSVLSLQDTPRESLLMHRPRQSQIDSINQQMAHVIHENAILSTKLETYEKEIRTMENQLRDVRRRSRSVSQDHLPPTTTLQRQRSFSTVLSSELLGYVGTLSQLFVIQKYSLVDPDVALELLDNLTEEGRESEIEGHESLEHKKNSLSDIVKYFCQGENPRWTLDEEEQAELVKVLCAQPGIEDLLQQIALRIFTEPENEHVLGTVFGRVILVVAFTSVMFSGGGTQVGVANVAKRASKFGEDKETVNALFEFVRSEYDFLRQANHLL